MARSGLWTVNECGGVTVVQDPASAAFPEMPRTALELVRPDHVVDLQRIPELLSTLVHQPAGESSGVSERTRLEVEIARGRVSTMGDLDHIGARSVLSCPECQGVMWEIDEGNLTRYRCHVGHTYSPDLMSIGLDEGLRGALGSAQRALEERIALASRLHQRAVSSGHRLLAQTWAARARESERDAEIIRESLRKIDRIVAREQLAQPDPKSSVRSSGS